MSAPPPTPPHETLRVHACYLLVAPVTSAARVMVTLMCIYVFC